MRTLASLVFILVAALFALPAVALIHGGGGAVASFSFPSGASAIYSTRKAVSAYAGNAVKRVSGKAKGAAEAEPWVA